MLVAVALAAGMLGWFVAARDRAKEQDAIIEIIQQIHGRMRIERMGPAWLELIGVDRYRRHIVGAAVDVDPLIRHAA